MLVSGAITDKVNLLARAGVFAWNTEYRLASASTSRSFDDDSSDVFIGLALESELIPKWPVRFGWTNYRVGDVNVDAWELGVVYLF